MNRRDAIDMIPRLGGDEDFIVATDQHDNKIVFPRNTARTVTVMDSEGQKCHVKLGDVMTGLVESYPVQGIDGGFAIQMETASFEEENGWKTQDEWILFRVGEIVPKKKSDSPNEPEKGTNGIGETEELTDDKIEIVEIARVEQEKEEGNGERPDMTMVDRFLERFDLEQDRREDYRERLAHFLEFTIDNDDWSTVEGLKKYRPFLAGKGLEEGRAVECCRPVSAFLDWLKETGVISYNPCKVYRWGKKDKGK